MQKSIKIMCLKNRTMDNIDNIIYNVMYITKEVLDDSISKGGSAELKEMLREQLDDHFHNEWDFYIDGITENDINKIIDSLAVGKKCKIQKDEFWWSKNELFTSL